MPDEPRLSEPSPLNMAEPLPSPLPEITPPAFLETPPPPSSNWLSGPAGVGWGFLLYLAMAFAIGALLSTAQQFVVRHPLGVIWQYMVGECVVLVAVIVPALVMSRLEGRPFGAYGLPGASAFKKAFWDGAQWGVVSLTALMLVLRAIGAFYFGSLALHGVTLIGYGVFWAIFFLVVAFFEEFAFRGYTLFTLSRGLGFWPAALILSIAFAAIHISNKGEAIRGLISAGLIGLFFCLSLRRTGNLWFAVGFHTSWNWAQTYFYSVANSGTTVPGHLLNSSLKGPDWLTGGSVGPEGSVLVFVLIVLIWGAFLWMYPEVKYEAS